MLPDDKGFEGRSDLGIYHHFTVAIDTDNIKRVFADVRDMGKTGHTLLQNVVHHSFRGFLNLNY